MPEETWESLEKARERERRFEARDAKIQATKEVCLSQNRHSMPICGIAEQNAAVFFLPMNLPLVNSQDCCIGMPS